MELQANIAKHFSAAAESYDQTAQLQASLGSSLLGRATSLSAPRRILEIGCGTGKLTAELASLFPNVPIDAVDLAPGMIEVARNNYSASQQINWICADGLSANLPGNYDLIVSASALHWMQPLKPLLDRIFKLCSARGTFLCSVMIRGTFAELHSLRAEIAPDNLPLQSFPTFSDVCCALREGGFQIHWSERREHSESFEDSSAFLSTIKERGFTGGDLSHSERLLTRGELRAICADYDSKYSNGNGCVRASIVAGLFGASTTSTSL